jgi:hypothetical protein
MCSKHVEALNKLIVKQKCCASIWLITRDKNTEMHCQQNIRYLVLQLMVSAFTKHFVHQVG